MIRIFVFLICLGLSSPCFTQTKQSWFEGMLFDSSAFQLEDAIKDSVRRHAIYSYNIANARTKGFEPILLAQDQQELFKLVPRDSEYFTRVLVSHMTSLVQRNSRRHAAYFALYRKKLDNWRQVVSLGKK